MTAVPTVPLSPGVEIPQVGLGTARVGDAEIRRIVRTALDDAGYTHIDTAAKYENEVGVGQGIADSGIDRDRLFVTTKLRGADQGHASAKAALQASLDRLGLDHVDLYLIHWPLPRVDRYVDSWRALLELAEAGLTRAVGVSNFTPRHLDRLAEATGTVPALNQVEVHPRFANTAQREDDARRGIVTESWSPLANAGDVLTDDTVRRIAADHGRSPAQVVLRWHVQHGLVPIPKASALQRLRENIAVFDFTLTDEEMAAVDALDTGSRTDPSQDPETHEEF